MSASEKMKKAAGCVPTALLSEWTDGVQQAAGNPAAWNAAAVIARAADAVTVVIMIFLE